MKLFSGFSMTGTGWNVRWGYRDGVLVPVVEVLSGYVWTGTYDRQTFWFGSTDGLSLARRSHVGPGGVDLYSAFGLAGWSGQQRYSRSAIPGSYHPGYWDGRRWVPESGPEYTYDYEDVWDMEEEGYSNFSWQGLTKTAVWHEFASSYVGYLSSVVGGLYGPRGMRAEDVGADVSEVDDGGVPEMVYTRY